MKRFFAVIAVVCLLSVPALAGEIPTMGAPQQAPETSSTDTQNSPGDIPTDGVPTPPTDPGDIPSDGLSAVLQVLGWLV